jgi:hypothetical protein
MAMTSAPAHTDTWNIEIVFSHFMWDSKNYKHIPYLITWPISMEQSPASDNSQHIHYRVHQSSLLHSILYHLNHFNIYTPLTGSQDSSVGIVTGYWVAS